MASKYQFTPSPRAGSFTKEYGGVPGDIAPPDPFADLESVYPNLTQTNAQASRNILAQLRGELSPETLAALQDDAARYGVSSGMPGSDLSFRRGTVRRAGAREALMQQGQQNYGGLAALLSKTQVLDPQFQAEIADRNANYAAAPDPRANANQLQRTFDQNRGGYGGGGGVTYSGRSGGMTPGGSAPPAPSDFWSGSTRGTGYEDRPYVGAYQSPLQPGFAPGPQGRDTGPQWYDPTNPNQGGNIDFGFMPGGGNANEGAAGGGFGQNQYDPFAEHGDYNGVIDFGAGDNSGASYDDYGSGGDFSPDWGYLE